jgi:hypothetical protein
MVLRGIAETAQLLRLTSSMGLGLHGVFLQPRMCGGSVMG